MANTKKVLYGYGVFLLISWCLMFVIYNKSYTSHYTVQGIGFICVVTLIFFILVNLYHKSQLGKKIVLWSLVGLFIINCICFIFSLN